MSSKFYFFLLIGTVIFSVSQVVHADTAADHSATLQFLQQIDKQKVTDAAGAVAAAQQFEQQHASIDPAELAKVDIALAHLYVENLKDPAKALAVLDAGMARSPKPGAYFPLLFIKYWVLGMAKRAPKAISLFKQNLPQLLKADPYYIKTALGYYLPIVKNGGKPADATSVLLQMLAVYPSLINFPKMGNGLVENLLLQPGHEEEALSYAKLYWQTCDFDSKTIGVATADLQKAWLAKDLNVVASSNFLKAQQDASAPNPLSQVATPALDDAAIQSDIKRCFPSPSPAFLYVHDHITLLLMQGKYGDAMLAARRRLLDFPDDSGQAATEIARIFKAADLNLIGANAFLQYFKTNQGANPLDDFFKKYPVGSIAPTPTPAKQ
jgi:hypothetical protein